MEIEIESMSETDLDRVVQIELETNLSFWGWEVYQAELNRSDSLCLVAVTNIIEEMKGDFSRKILGFAFARLITPEVEIINIAVDKNYQRHGAATKLLDVVLLQSENRGCRICLLEVRESNQAAREFYYRYGFQAVGRRKKYYRNPVEDAILLNAEIKK